MSAFPPPNPAAPLPVPVAGVGAPVTHRGMIAVNAVSKFFGSIVAVSDVSFGINDGVTALLGPNGAGKSTLFRMLCGLTPRRAGRSTSSVPIPATTGSYAVASPWSPSRMRCSTISAHRNSSSSQRVPTVSPHPRPRQHERSASSN